MRAQGTVMGGMVVATLAALSLLACSIPNAVRPIRSISYLPLSGVASKTAVLMMPGRRSRAEDFESNGFVAAVRERKLAVEIVAVDAHLGYYVNERYHGLADALQADIVQPLLSRGTERIWLVGTSLGALGSIAYVKKYPANVAGLLLMGAYLGEDPILDDIQRAKWLGQWEPTSGVGYDYEVRTWQWLKGYIQQAPRPDLYLAYGKRDRFATASVILSTAVPASRILVAENGHHDFDTWNGLWQRFLDRFGKLLQAPSTGTASPS